MELGVWIMTIFTAILGLAGIWAAIFDVSSVFQSRKIGFLEKRIGRGSARLLVGLGGIALIALAASFVLIPPG